MTFDPDLQTRSSDDQARLPCEFVADSFSGFQDIRRKLRFFCPWWPWPLIFDLDLQTCPSEGRSTSSLWIWRQFVQRFPINTNKNVTDSAKNRNLRSSLCAVINSSLTILPHFKRLSLHYRYRVKSREIVGIFLMTLAYGPVFLRHLVVNRQLTRRKSAIKIGNVQTAQRRNRHKAFLHAAYSNLSTALTISTIMYSKRTNGFRQHDSCSGVLLSRLPTRILYLNVTLYLVFDFRFMVLPRPTDGRRIAALIWNNGSFTQDTLRCVAAPRVVLRVVKLC